MYYYNDDFYSEIEEIIEDLDLDKMKEDETIRVENSTLEPIVTLSAELIAESLDDYLCDRYSELYAEEECKEIIKALNDNIDFNKLNSQLPKLYYPNNTFKVLTKSDLITLRKQSATT
ncbi:MAG: hypothetical protein VB046_06760 [Paludibacter sp.]|nr:hypothetical protein [Paludibacter sp.]